MSALLSLQNVSVSYGRIQAVRDVSVSIEPGRIVTIIGPNGAGKTTLMQAAMGLLPSEGAMHFDGAPLAAVDVETRVERGMCLVPERRELFHDMSVEDNLTLGAYARRANAEIKRDLDEVFDRLEDCLKQLRTAIETAESEKNNPRVLTSSHSSDDDTLHPGWKTLLTRFAQPPPAASVAVAVIPARLHVRFGVPFASAPDAPSPAPVVVRP